MQVTPYLLQIDKQRREDIVMNNHQLSRGLYDASHDRDSCGVTLVADMHGRPSSKIVDLGLDALARMEHRGALGADGRTGDGVGILTQIPDAFFRRISAEKGVSLPPPGDYCVGMFFLPPEPERLPDLKTTIDKIVTEEGFQSLLWRLVPTNGTCLGSLAKLTEPSIWQLIFAPCAEEEDSGFEGQKLRQKLYIIKSRIESVFVSISPFAVVSLDNQTIVHKGMMLAHDLATYFPDLKHPEFVSALAVVHARFSTNTFPSWRLAQPFHRLCHNGEINTLRGNLASLRSREKEICKRLFTGREGDVTPLIKPGLSDSAYLDTALELLILAGKSLPEALMILIPEAWQKNQFLSPNLRAFYEFHAPLMEPWDGPAAVIASDGIRSAVTLDRNGLRPCRYAVTKQGLFVASSEAGAVPLPWEEVISHGRLSPGEIIVVDPTRGGLLGNDVVKAQIAAQYAYESWVGRHLLNSSFVSETKNLDAYPSSDDLVRLQIANGFTREEITMVMQPMANTGEEPVSSMGDDTPIAALSDEPRLLYDFFRQQFAQVTNPPIDPLREDLVMSLKVYLGRKGSPFRDPIASDVLCLEHPILRISDLNHILEHPAPSLSSCRISTLIPIENGTSKFQDSLENLVSLACERARQGFTVLVLSDRGMTTSKLALPALLAVSAVHHELVHQGRRDQVDLIIETAEARTVHHMALLLGYGAQAIVPYLALDTVRDLFGKGALPNQLSEVNAQANYIKSLKKGLLKVLSKMGIATLRSYNGAQIFEAIGLSKDLVEKYFQGTSSALGGWPLEKVATAGITRHQRAFSTPRVGEKLELPTGGSIHYRVSGERHAWRPETIAHLQHAAKSGDQSAYAKFRDAANGINGTAHYLRHLLEFKREGTCQTQIEDIEEAASVVKRFTTGAMSLGAISREAHETLALAMNALGGKSNSGEGGEDPDRAHPLPNGGSKISAIRQIASARFGVTLEYLAQGRELQIKIAQGAKPGEGGQLPGHKVDAEIARLRHSTPGVALISPPPHHDIYSIEDLAQLIHDLREANPNAQVSVKLVSASGIGAVAAGVAKAGADKIVISCGSGGTGASPLSSIKHVGLPWEMGLAETHQALVANGLRPWVRLEVDGQLKTGRDVVIGSLLGADEFGFATAPLIATGCIMMRKCHLNTCPVGIATQDPELRAKFQGKPEHVINYMFLVAEEARQLLATLGLKSLAEARGRTDLLTEKKDLTEPRGLDLRPLLFRPEPPPVSNLLPKRPVSNASIQILSEDGVITTTHRSFGTRLSFQRYAAQKSGVSLSPLTLTTRGYAGQSLGAFLTRGVTLILNGIANDYVGKGLSGGTIIVKPPVLSSWGEASPAVVGNTVLYGATSGKLFVAGSAGERFAVRNSGAVAVVEGTGNHGCEYMTGGTVVVLGMTGRNFAAGMSGGYAYVYDEDGDFCRRVNIEMVILERLTSNGHVDDLNILKALVEVHERSTHSLRARSLLADWEESSQRFVKVIPKELHAQIRQSRNLRELAKLTPGPADPAPSGQSARSSNVDVTFA